MNTIFKILLTLVLLVTFRLSFASNDSILIYSFYQNKFKLNTPFVLYVDHQKIDSITTSYTIFHPCSLGELVHTIPFEYYKVKDKSLLCFFHGDEDYSKISEKYVRQYIDTLKYFFKDESSIEIISWGTKKIKINDCIDICDPIIFGIIIKNGKIIHESYAKSRFYWQNFIQYNIDYKH